MYIYIYMCIYIYIYMCIYIYIYTYIERVVHYFCYSHINSMMGIHTYLEDYRKILLKDATYIYIYIYIYYSSIETVGLFWTLVCLELLDSKALQKKLIHLFRFVVRIYIYISPIWYAMNRNAEFLGRPSRKGGIISIPSD